MFIMKNLEIFSPFFKPQNKIVYNISYYKLGLANFQRRYILKSPYVHGKWTVVEAFVGEEDFGE